MSTAPPCRVGDASTVDEVEPRCRGGRRALAFAVVVVLLGGLLPQLDRVADAQEPEAITIEQVNEALGAGVNFGNALEAPREGEWGLTLQADYFALIAQAGFDHVRVPIKFSAYAEETAPYTIPEGIDPTIPNANNLWERIDWVIEEALANDLYVIIDLHHYDELHADPAAHRDRFVAIWDQIATRYADADARVLFELLNEPNDAFSADPALLNDVLAQGLATVRATNPTRPVLVGPAAFNGIGALNDLVLPDDPNLIVSVHFYDPFWFTHQGATWVDPVPPAPASFDPDLFQLSGGWQNWSWDTELVASSEGFTATFARQYAGLQFARPGEPVDPVTLEMQVVGSGAFDVRCGAGTDPVVDAGSFVTEPATTTVTVDLTACPPQTTLVQLQMTDTSFEPLEIAAARVCHVGPPEPGCVAIVQPAGAALVARLEQAAAWGRQNNRPMNVGEFGAYGADGLADLSERATWAAIVSSAGRDRGMSMTWWEFGAGFGVYDPDNGEWITPLRDALLPVTPPMVLGDATCSGLVDLLDALAIVQFQVGLRTDAGECPLADPATQIHAVRADVDGNGVTTMLDALLIAQCHVGLPNRFCPA